MPEADRLRRRTVLSHRFDRLSRGVAMAHFGKFANLNPAGWDAKAATQKTAAGQNTHIGLWGGGPSGEDLTVKSVDPTVCVVHEEPLPKSWPHWRHFLLTALRAGEARIDAVLPGTTNVWASMKVVVAAHAGVRLVFFPGERLEGSITVGTIYVIGAGGESMKAAGGPPTGRPDRGGHTIDPTPAGSYVLGPRIRVVAPSWPTSAIAWGSALRLNAKGEVEFESAPGVWRQATGPSGVVTTAQMAFQRRSGLKPDLATITREVRGYFVDAATGKLWSTTWEWNDFGRWGWNLRKNGQATPYYVHTTPDDEHDTDQGKAVHLANSHGCVHLVPKERDRLMSAGYLKEGVPFEVRPYTETGPP
jgi:hypothetical protein